MTMEKKYQNTFSYALLIYMCIIILIITLSPFDFQTPEKIRVFWILSFRDYIANIILFIPVGFLLTMSHRNGKESSLVKILVYGALFSLLIESAQQFLPDRFPQVSDIIINGLGAMLGGLILIRLRRHTIKEHAGKVSTTELPLMNIIYLLTPLMWINGLSNAGDIRRLFLLIILGLCGSAVLSSIYKYRLRNAGIPSINKFTLFVIIWFFIGAGPFMLNHPIPTIILAFFIWIIVQVFVRLSLKIVPKEKRFELPTLKRFLPLYAIYLLLLAVFPITLPEIEWQLKQGFQIVALDEHILLTFRFVEFIAAFTLLGYMIAEMRGRKDERVETTLGWTFFIAAGSAIFIEIVKTYPVLSSISILSIVIITSASIYGAVIYRLQLSAIERLNF
jgi:glycopeptide antibiotics resistance protein